MTTRSQMLAIHSGAEVIGPDAMTPESEAAYHAGLRAALVAGHALARTDELASTLPVPA